MFTNKSHSDNGKISAALGVVSFVSLCVIIYTSYRQEGGMNPKLGAAAVFALVYAIGGEALGIVARLEKDRFYLFPNIGLILNTLVIILIGVLLYLGVRSI
jgi:lipopolysaccharide export LptBFGC system permease protein LptF